jgi:hypothetical protein
MVTIIHSPQKKKPRRCIGDATGDSTQQLRCDCCKHLINDDNHIQNNPCNHNICLICVLKANMKRVAYPVYCQVIGCHQKFTISCQYFNRGIPGEIIENGTIVELGIDEVASILSFLPLKKIMFLRCVNMTWREAARKTTISPTTALWTVNNVARYNATRVMTTELPNLHGIIIGDLIEGSYIDFENSVQRNKYNDGEDPDEYLAARNAHKRPHDIEIISNFSKLHHLAIVANGSLNGRYPFLFNSFPLLQKLTINTSNFLKWDLEMLAGFPLLKELNCSDNEHYMTGNMSSLRVLKDTLERVEIVNCPNIEGNFMDLADFPHLKVLDLARTAVTGDIRDIDENDFSSLERLPTLPGSVHGAYGCMLHRISDGPDLATAVYLLRKQRPTLFDDDGGDGPMPWFGRLSTDSPDWYDAGRDDVPFDIVLVQAGSRVGYRWESEDGKHQCEVNWLDPEPGRESNDYEAYIAESLGIALSVSKYRGFHQPPTEEEYNGLPLFRFQRAPR